MRKISSAASRAQSGWEAMTLKRQIGGKSTFVYFLPAAQYKNGDGSQPDKDWGFPVRVQRRIRGKKGGEDPGK